MELATGRSDADAAGFLEFLERCHDALRRTPAVTRGRFLNCGRMLTTFHSWEGLAVIRSALSRSASS